jgi:Arc/MetJ-type ribon-helix-helix transcriptional regulator
MTVPRARTTITIDSEVLNQVRSAVAAGAATSVSAYIEHAVRGQLAAETEFDGVIDEILSETGGAATTAEKSAAAALLSDSAA